MRKQTAWCNLCQMPDEASKDRSKRKYKHWTKFVSETPSIRKAKKRSATGLCIGCGKKPCTCKRPASLR
jgi:hypothetical protein